MTFVLRHQPDKRNAASRVFWERLRASLLLLADKLDEVEMFVRTVEVVVCGRSQRRDPTRPAKGRWKEADSTQGEANQRRWPEKTGSGNVRNEPVAGLVSPAGVFTGSSARRGLHWEGGVPHLDQFYW